MALYQWGVGERITAERLKDAYDLLKGTAGGEDSVAPNSSSAWDFRNVPASSFLLPDDCVGSSQLVSSGVLTSHLGANAATADTVGAGTADFSLTGTVANTSVTGLSATLNTVGGDVLLWFSGPAHVSSGTVSFTFKQDAAVLGNTLMQLSSSMPANMPCQMVHLYAAPSVGSHTYDVMATLSGVAATLTMNMGTVANARLMAVELRR